MKAALATWAIEVYAQAVPYTCAEIGAVENDLEIPIIAIRECAICEEVVVVGSDVLLVGRLGTAAER
jgi:hypothetical protein